MKINKKILKQIITEELEEITSAAAGDDGVVSRADLVKQQRSTKGADLARDASGLSGQEVSAQALLNSLSKILAQPGNQAGANVVRLLQQALVQAKKGVKQ